MARPPKLNWDMTRGKWRVVYRGKKYRFDGGAGKSDREAKKRAEAAWRKTKAELDLEVEENKPHWAKYQATIAEWELVRAWSRQHPEAPMAQEMEVLSTKKLQLLHRGLAAKKPEPVRLEDIFEGQFRPRPEGLRETYERLIQSLAQKDGEAEVPEGVVGVVDPRQLNADIDKSDPLAIEKALWEDRLAVMRNVPTELTVGAQIDRFVAAKSADAAAGQRSRGRSYLLKLYLTHFGEWIGRETPVLEITEPVLDDYRQELLKRVEAREWSATTASHRLEGIKTFVRSLWRRKVLPVIPRNMDGKSGGLKISEGKPKVVVFTKQEIGKLLTNASDKTKLYTLLCLNCAFTQKDIADLRHDEMDWTAGRITRKRSKTRDEENVPEVSFRLWPITLRLLMEQRTNDGIEVLRNENGERLWYDKVVNGKYTKIDNVSCAFGRLCRKLKISKPIKSLKKTSATLIRNNANYANLEDLFLGHAPRKLSDKRYTLPPEALLDQAIDWLHEELEIAEAMNP